MQSYHDWYVEEITELEESTIDMWSEPLKIAKWIFHLSYLYLSFTCLIISLVVDLLVSIITGKMSVEIGRSLKIPNTFGCILYAAYKSEQFFRWNDKGI